MASPGGTHSIATDAARGAAAGVVATGAMSVVMLAAERTGLMSRIPPHEIASRVVARTPLRDDVGASGRRNLGWIAHFGFGAALGAAFGLARGRIVPPGPAVPQSMAFAGAVWLVSYLGWLPAVGLMPRATHDEPNRQPAMVVAHAVFGAVLGPVADGLGTTPGARG
jgi:hypothetical protein